MAYSHDLAAAYTHSDLQGALPLLTRGKVRDLYEVDENTLLFVATDRISAYDVIMENGIPQKGLILTLLTTHWFTILQSHLPNLKTHFITLTLPTTIPPPLHPVLRGRSMQVQRLRIFPLEAIVRGYLTGSAWSEYTQSGTVHSHPLPAGLQESEKIPNGPLYTPSTKAEQGAHDENISVERAAEIVGANYATRIQELALEIYRVASDYAWERGVIIADTKFEFGLDEATDEVVLVDEVLTPDSSRFWGREAYEKVGVGRGQASLDKQFLRDWLTVEGLKGKEGVRVPDHVAEGTASRYRQVFRMLTGKELEEVLRQENMEGS